jgi:hypothetical protein
MPARLRPLQPATVALIVPVISVGAQVSVVSTVEILIYGLILFTLFHQSIIVALHCDSIMSYYSS